MVGYIVCNVGIIGSKLVSFEVKAETKFKTMRGSSDSDTSVVEMYFKLMSRGFWDCTVYFPEVTSRSISSVSVTVREARRCESRDELIKSLVLTACRRIIIEAKSMASRADSIICYVGGANAD